VWVCIGWHNSTEREIFADNSKYFFLYLQNEQSDITSVWLAKDRKLASILHQNGYRSYYQHSLLGIYYALRAKYTIVDAHISLTNWKFSNGSNIIQLWHGKGMKKSGHTQSRFNNRSQFLNPNQNTKYFKIVATSPKTAELIAETFSQPPTDVIVTGQPRTDVFFDSINGSNIDTNVTLQRIVMGAKEHSDKKLILYAPTFRPDGSNPLDQIEDSLHEFNSLLKEKNWFLLLCLHPKFASKQNTETHNLSHIMSIEPGFDLYPHLKDIDILITDYSNIYIDFLLLDKELVFFTFDKDWYAQETGLYDDFEELTPGPHVTDFDQLLIALQTKDAYKEQRERVRKTLFDHQDGFSAKRVFDELTDNTVTHGL
jgi:CDP-glycerol glycerophosphotransferase (TagB/SpsB family)